MASTSWTRAFLVGVAATLFVLFVVAVVVMQQRKENARKADIEYVKEFTIRLRQTFCSEHIGELKGVKHEAALKWWRNQAFAMEGKEHRMTESDLNTCMELK